ncbi:hypothetical protein ACFO6V_07210 [Promicromonospora alba]|uniref:HEPN AbiU2-like domain-containing protein n=1 Tax=Promicromonospora alba TaxID=1616110 RepID=A0ABV9HDF8_9MICO
MSEDRAEDQDRTSIFEVFPAETQSTLIMKWPDHQRNIGYEFARAAERLASTFQGQPADDLLLHPFLYLYRHAIETAIKDLIHDVAAFRRLKGEHGKDVDRAKIELRHRREVRHDLAALLIDLDAQMSAAAFPGLPDDVRDALALLIDADPKGNSFRFPTEYMDTNRIDFPKLAAMLDDVYSLITAGGDMVDAASQAQSDYMADMAAEAPDPSDYY